MSICMHDRYYEPEDDGYPDDFDWKIENLAFEMLRDELNMYEPFNWAEGLTECGYDDGLYPTPSHAPVEVIDKVSEYWYDIAFKRATRYYEENPYND